MLPSFIRENRTASISWLRGRRAGPPVQTEGPLATGRSRENDETLPLRRQTDAADSAPSEVEQQRFAERKVLTGIQDPRCIAQLDD